MKNIVVVQGGGRPNGNTSRLVSAFIQGAEAAGHKVELIDLNRVTVNGCLGCNCCRYGKPCVQKDDFNEISPKIIAADLVVFASPLYFYTITAKLKALIERFYAIALEDPNPILGRYDTHPVHDSALLMTAGDDLFWTFTQAENFYRYTIVNYIGFNDKGTLLCGGCGLPDEKPQIDSTGYLEKAYDFGFNIYKKED